MKQGWEIKAFDDCIEKVKVKTKLPSSSYQKEGAFPIVSQEKELISGYWDNEEDVITLSTPATIFGDHTMVVKYIDFDFVVGADGVKILKPKSFLNPKYFYYWVRSADISSRGYARHYRYLREKIVSIPSLAEQKRIVEILDREFERIDALKANAEQNLQHAKDLFQAALRQELQPKAGWETKTIGEIAELKGGKRVPKGYKLEINPTGYPYIRVADFNDIGTVDLDDIHYISKEVFEGIKRYIITTNDVYISIAGTIGKSGIIPEELNGANLTENACRLVFKEKAEKKYIYYCTIGCDFKEQIAKLTMQAAQPKLALTRLATAVISLPSLSEQESIVARLDKLSEHCKSLEDNYKRTIALCDDMKQALLRKAFNGEL